VRGKNETAEKEKMKKRIKSKRDGAVSTAQAQRLDDNSMPVRRERPQSPSNLDFELSENEKPSLLLEADGDGECDENDFHVVNLLGAASAFDSELDASVERTYRRNQLQPIQLLLPSVVAIIVLISSLGVWNGQRLPPLVVSGADLESEVQQQEQVIVPTVESVIREDLAEPDLNGSSQLAPFFEPSVLYWEADIVHWANRHNLDPNMVATIMQIESCGDPNAVSRSGAMGLFQVMPFHFKPSEDGFDPNTNSLRGMNYLAERLIQTDGE